MFQKIFEENPDLSPQMKQWIGKAIGGALVADGKVHVNERAELAKWLPNFQKEPELVQALNAVIEQGAPSLLETVNLPSNLSEAVFKLVLRLCASDFELHLGELRYLNRVGLALSIDPKKRLRLIRSTVRAVKLEYFSEMLKDIYAEERFWLASVILKTIYADGRVDKKEIPYLNSVYQLLQEHPDELEFVKADAKNPSLDKLPPVDFDPELSKRILRYLMEIVMNDDHDDEREIKFINAVAAKLGFSDEDVEDMTREVQAINQELEDLYSM